MSSTCQILLLLLLTIVINRPSSNLLFPALLIDVIRHFSEPIVAATVVYSYCNIYCPGCAIGTHNYTSMPEARGYLPWGYSAVHGGYGTGACCLGIGAVIRVTDVLYRRFKYRTLVYDMFWLVHYEALYIRQPQPCFSYVLLLYLKWISWQQHSSNSTAATAPGVVSLLQVHLQVAFILHAANWYEKSTIITKIVQ